MFFNTTNIKLTHRTAFIGSFALENRLYTEGVLAHVRKHPFPNTEGYRYSFNGKEDDTEWAKQDFGARIYDKRLGRWLSIDPKFKDFPNNSAYCYALNNPIVLVDNDGEIPIIPLILKMATNGAADYLMQVAMNYYFNDETRGDLTAAATNVNNVQILRSALEGAIPWKTPGGLLGRAAVTATLDVLQNYAHEKLKGKEYSGEQALVTIKK